MTDSYAVPSQPSPDEATGQSGTCPQDCDLPENSQENLDARLDHAIEETFPTSDPISVIVTKQAVAEVPRETGSPSPSSQSRKGRTEAEQDTAEQLLDQVREALQDVALTASGAASEAYTEGQRYVRHARDRYPQAEQYYRAGPRAIRQRTTENPLMSRLLAGAIGYALA